MNVLALELCLCVLAISSVYDGSSAAETFEDGASNTNDNKANNQPADFPKPFDIDEEAFEIKDVSDYPPPKPFDITEREEEGEDANLPKPLNVKEKLVGDDIAIAELRVDSVLSQDLNTFSKREHRDDSLPVWNWKKKDLTWILLNGPSGQSGSTITMDDVVRDIEQALRLWSSVTPLTFTRRYTGDADLRISFASKEHGDNFEFDGQGGVAAHAFPPIAGNSLDGDVHVDDDEVFTKNDGKFGTNFLYVITHEIGHALGLYHSKYAMSIMEGFVKAGLPYSGERLPDTDAHTIQDLYGNKPGIALVPSEPPTPVPTPPAGFNCKGDDYAATVFRGSLILLQDDKFWRFQADGVNSDLISPPTGNKMESYFKGLPDGVESAFTLYNGTTVYTKGSEWYLFDMRQIEGKQNGNPEHVDAAFHDERTRSSYFFKGDYMVIFNHRTNVRSGKKLITTEFRGLPGDLSAAFTDWQGDRFFMKANRYWKYRQGSTSVEPGYPKTLPSDLCGSAK